MASDYLMWVGYSNYPTIRHFVEEAENLGVSKRLSRVPNGLVPGKTRIYLAHDEGIPGDAVIFGYFVVGQIEVIVPSGTEIPEYLAHRLSCEAVPIPFDEASKEPKRGCGYRQEVGAIYAVSSAALNELSVYSDDVQVRGGIVVFDDPIDYAETIGDPECRRFRSLKSVDGDEIEEGPTRRSPLEENPPLVTWDRPPAKSQAPWSEEERELLRHAIETVGSVGRGLREASRVLGRSYRSVEYQWYHKRRDE
jgi:hypothetical protein